VRSLSSFSRVVGKVLARRSAGGAEVAELTSDGNSDVEAQDDEVVATDYGDFTRESCNEGLEV